MKNTLKAVSLLIAGVCVFAQAPPPALGPGDLDVLVQRIALYPDALLANILTAATYPDQIPEADQWAAQHSALHGHALARAIQDDHVPWDPSVQALLPFGQVLQIMARDIAWTEKLGDAVLSQKAAVMDAIQRDRRAAQKFGYLRVNSYYKFVDSGGFIEIDAINPTEFVVPVYDPAILFVAPKAGFAVVNAINFSGPKIGVGVSFAPWGWGPGVYAHFNWGGHTLFVDNHEWTRTWANRREYAHPTKLPHYEKAKRVEKHKVPPPRKP